MDFIVLGSQGDVRLFVLFQNAKILNLQTQFEKMSNVKNIKTRTKQNDMPADLINPHFIHSRAQKTY